MRSVGMVRPASSDRSARTARCLGGPRSTDTPSRSTARPPNVVTRTGEKVPGSGGWFGLEVAVEDDRVEVPAARPEGIPGDHTDASPPRALVHAGCLLGAGVEHQERATGCQRSELGG